MTVVISLYLSTEILKLCEICGPHWACSVAEIFFIWMLQCYEHNRKDTLVHNIYLLFVTVVRCSPTESLVGDALGGYYKTSTRQNRPYVFAQYETAVSTNRHFYYFEPYLAAFFCKGFSNSAILSPEKRCNYKLSAPKQN